MLTLLRKLAERLYQGGDEGLPIVTGTATGGTTTTLVDDGEQGLKYSSADANEFDRWWVYNETGGDAGRVTEGGLAGSTGTLTISPAITTFGTGTPKYIITKDAPSRLKKVINNIIISDFKETFFPLSMFITTGDDNDMETDPATNYTASNATLANETSIVLSGAQSLKVTASAANGYARTDSLSVNESESLYAAVLCSVTQGDDAEFRIVDIQDSNATIESATTDEPAHMELKFLFAVPSDCKQIQAWMMATGNGDVAYYDDFQIWASGVHVYSLPSWITRESQVVGVYEFPQGTTGPASDNDFRLNERASNPIPWEFEQVSRFAAQELQIVAVCSSSRPYVKLWRAPTELTSDSSSTICEENFVLDWAERIMREPEREAEFLATLRARSLARVTSSFPRRTG